MATAAKIPKMSKTLTTSIKVKAPCTPVYGVIERLLIDLFIFFVYKTLAAWSKLKDLIFVMINMPLQL
jgi:hypothetical protein